VATQETTSLDAIDAGLRSVFRGSLASRMHERLRTRAGVDLDRPGMQVLGLLAEGPLRLSDIAGRLALDLSTVSRKVAQLERQGLVVRAEDPRDRRASTMALSETGRDAHSRLMQGRREMLGEIFADWPEDDRRELARLLGRLADAFTTYRSVL